MAINQGIGSYSSKTIKIKPTQVAKTPKQVKPPKVKTPSLGGLTAPPFGSYDPDLDAQGRSAQVGLQDLKDDTATAHARDAQDLYDALGQLGVKHARETQSFDTSATRENRDFTSALTDLTRRYKIQGDVQGSAANAAGVLDAGTLAASAKARGANQALDTNALNTKHGDFMGDLETRRAQAEQDNAYDTSHAQRSYDQSQSDEDLKLRRGDREAAAFAQNILAKKVFQAHQLDPSAFAALGATAAQPKKKKKKGK